MQLKCAKCGSTNIAVGQDSRGLPEARCKDCDSFIKKMGATEVYEYFSSSTPTTSEQPKPKKAQCRYCTEIYAIKRGRLGNEYYPYKPKFCPECGRELEDEDFFR